MANKAYLQILVSILAGLVCSFSYDIFLTERGADFAANDNPFASILPSSTLQWKSCYENTPANKLGPISCARLLVPLDYSNASVGNVQLAIVKLEGSGAGDAVFYNPGGPGGDPVEDVLSKVSLLRAYVGNELDIIAVVPRGVGATFPPITCDASNFDANEQLWEIQNTLPGYTKESLIESYAIGESVGLDCGLIKPNLIPYIGTVSVAHDMEFVRQTLGQKQLHYLGFSYGTTLGGTYAALFPERVGRMVLDGVLDFNDYYSPIKDPSLDIGDADLALDNFFQACHDAGADACPIWSQSIQDIRKSFQEADRQIYKEPLPVAGFGLVKWPLWRSGVYNALYRPSEGFLLLAGATAEILSGSAGPYIEAYADIVQSAATVRYPVDPKTGLRNSPNAGNYISCADSGAPSKSYSTTHLATTFSQYQEVSEFFAGISYQFVLICWGARLSTDPQYTSRFESITTANPILFVGNTADPTTPIRNAHRMSAAFTGSRVLTVAGTGHLSFNAAQDPTRCASKWIAPFFRDGTLPPSGTVCDGMQMPFASSGP